MSSNNKLVFAALVGAYLWAPVLAGMFEVGDRWGPKLYPVALHRVLYGVGWMLTSHAESKPRVGSWFKKELRPWFYGLPSGNSVPRY